MMRSGRSTADARGRFSISGTPILRALLIQLLAFAFVLTVAHLAAVIGFEPAIAHAVLLQAAFAACMAALLRMARWWLAIQFVFPFAAVVAFASGLPSWIFLAAFVALLALYWNTFRTQVPFYPSGPRVWEAVAGMLPSGRPLSFIDIGSGFGGLAMHLAVLRPESRIDGIESAPLPWLWSRLRARGGRRGANFLRGDYERIDLAGYDVVFAYLSPAAMPALWRKASREMRPGSLLLSYEFPIPEQKPQIMLRPIENGPLLYGWRF